MSSASKIFYNGDIITMTDEACYPEALAVTGGAITAVGTLSDLQKYNPRASKVDLGGKTLMPAFFDPHTHLFSVVMSLGMADLQPPPVGNVNSISRIKETMRKYIADKGIKPGNWIVGGRYDHNGLAEQRHPTRDELDEISDTNPVFLYHLAMHYGVANSVALKMAKLDKDTPDPNGGRIGRYPGTTVPNGVLEEQPALSYVWRLIPKEVLGFNEDAFKKAFSMYAAHGITTIQEPSGASQWCYNILRPMVEKTKLPLDVILYPRGDVAVRRDAQDFREFKSYRNGLRIGGVKLMLDGSIQGHTAYLTKPYYKNPTGVEDPVYGFPLYEDQDELNDIFMNCFRKGWQILAHSNGDATTDQILGAVRKCLNLLPEAMTRDHRTTIIHGQVLRRDQLEEIKRLGIGISFFPGHIYYWGDKHIHKYLGRDRAYFLDPVKAAVDMGIPVTIHNDCTVTPMSILDVIYFATNRYTQSGEHMGPDQEISRYDALKAVTINAARQHFEEQSKGSLEVGKMADLIIVSQNPLKVEPSGQLREVKVLETIKTGETIYRYTDQAPAKL